MSASLPWDLAVIGGGPAGLACATTARGLGLRVVLFEGSALGGELNTLTRIEDVFGLPSTDGPDLAANLVDQALDAAVEIDYREVASIAREQEFWSLDGGHALARAVVFATGSAPELSGLPGAATALGRGVSVCASCDGPLFRDKAVAVIGSGRDALSEALELAPHAAAVHLIAATELAGPPALISAVREHPRITVRTGFSAVSVDGSPVSSLLIRGADGDQTLSVDGVFPAAARSGRVDLVAKAVDVSDDLIAVDAKLCCAGEDLGESAYAVGDVRSGSSNTISGAIGDGTSAAWTVLARLS